MIKKTIAGAVLLAAVSSAPLVSAAETSGFLGNFYPKLKEETLASGEKVTRWISPALDSGRYSAVVLNKFILYPQPKPTDQVSADLLRQVTAYADQALQRELQGVIKIVDAPGPDTLIFSPAITAAAAVDEGLKAYELIPVPFVFSRVQKATGHRAKDAVLAMEWKAQDASSNELVGAGMREGIGAKLDEPNSPVTLELLKPLIDQWASDARDFFNTVKPRNQ
jgi:hypothetical protein